MANLNKYILDNLYRGCGRAWASVDQNGEIVAIRYMDDHGLADVERIDHPDRRYRSGVRTEYRRMDTYADFSAYRTSAKAFLLRIAGQGGRVIGGMCSCCEFTPL